MRFKSFIKTTFLFAVLIIGFTAFASAQTTHTVEAGETLFNIAQQYNVEVQQLKQWNNLHSNRLSIGQVLTVRKSSPEKIVHTVEAGETLFSISKKYDVNIAELKSWNNLSTSSLDVGQKLTVYPGQSTDQQDRSIVVDKKTQQNTYYVVKSGDSLYRIAAEHGMTVKALKILNDLRSNTIRVGQHLTVRAPSTPPSIAKSAESSPQGKFIAYRVSGESLPELLSTFKMSEDEFWALNPDADSSLRSGQQVTVLAPPGRSYENPYLVSADLQNLGSTKALKYSASAKGTSTTNGELYNPEALTAAHSNISLGSVIFIKNKENEKGIYVRINDRISGNGLKLSSAAWNVLGLSEANPAVTIYQNQ
ncbi:MAG TPA: LysM peptidoglycan-binding domain-containing protein [Balneolaceae bacterium]|nr:LysM peptidoglycan-binding domain-containing protein [Balneolaceae bacterium]